MDTFVVCLISLNKRKDDMNGSKLNKSVCQLQWFWADACHKNPEFMWANYVSHKRRDFKALFDAAVYTIVFVKFFILKKYFSFLLIYYIKNKF